MNQYLRDIIVIRRKKIVNMYRNCVLQRYYLNKSETDEYVLQKCLCDSTASQPGRGNGGSTLMKVQCPRNCRPGSEIKIMVPGKGQMKVQVPANTAPGQFFYFRVMNSY